MKRKSERVWVAAAIIVYMILMLLGTFTGLAVIEAFCKECIK